MNEKELIQKSKKTDVKVLIIFIILSVLVLLLLYVLPKFNIDGSQISFLLIILCLVSLKLFSSISNNILRFSKIKKFLISKYNNDFIINKKPKKEIIYGEKGKVGNKRKNYVFSTIINKYNCIFNCYCIETLQSNDTPYDRPSSNFYKKNKYINEYIYDLSKFGIIFNENILNTDSIQNIINELSMNKIITVYIHNNNLIIQKETMKENYTKSFAEIDVNDIEEFYNLFINTMIAENNKLYSNTVSNL